MTLDEMLPRLDNVRRGAKSRWRTDSYTARCPAHDDRINSLTVTQTHDGQLMVNCFAGCSFESILIALGQTTIGRKWAKIDQFWREVENRPAPKWEDTFEMHNEYFAAYEEERDAVRTISDAELLGRLDAANQERVRRKEQRGWMQ